MESHKIVQRGSTAALEDKFEELMDACSARGDLQAVLVAMAATIQKRLNGPEAKRLPHAGALDPIMRAVEHTLRGDPRMNDYVLEKLNYGTRCLNNWMSPVGAR